MNRFLWLLLNLALVAVFCGVGLLLAEGDPRSRWDEVRKDAVASGSPAAAKVSQPPVGQDSAAAAVRDTLDSKTLEVLWRRSLFRPDRTEDVVVQAEEDGGEPPEQQDEWTFELRATAKMGDYLVAIIQIDAAKRAPARPSRPIRNARSIGRPGLPQPKEEAPKAKKPKRLFREGDELNETGYVLVEIRMGEALIRKGSDEKVLTIDRMDPASVQRREAAAKALAADKPPAAEAKDEGKDKTPSRPASMPPPPPGGPGGPGTPTGATIAAPTAASAAMEARRKRIAAEQKRRLELQRASRTTN